MLKDNHKHLRKCPDSLSKKPWQVFHNTMHCLHDFGQHAMHTLNHDPYAEHDFFTAV